MEMERKVYEEQILLCFGSRIQNNATILTPASLLPGFSAKCAFSYKKNVDIWRSKAQKLKMVLPYDIFLSGPHVSASGTIGIFCLVIDFGKLFIFILQIAGPFSFRVDSGVSIDFKDKSWRIQADQPVFAIEYALHVLCSAKAVAWYSTKHQEFMVELRFFET
ncbi:hypothetical protein V6N11_006145 [Hibiscus sabdariffa]|uniref:Uncharacterized protein n=1 Tax=Hibiscus sabdariffa TaxID=183260 RepID=A0ABR2RPY1_9ROSI